MAMISRRGSRYQDVLRSNSNNDMLLGYEGNDMLLDGGRHGQRDSDIFNGGRNDDVIRAHWGSDVLRGDFGNDVLVSLSDAGEPVIGQAPNLPKVYPGEPLAQANDTLNGGLGADTFVFHACFNGRPEVVARHADWSGTIDWEAVGEENGAPHDHWVESLGIDTIQDYYRAEGDRIEINAHSAVATIAYRDSNGDGRGDMSLVRLTSDSGGTGAHHGDLIGIIRIFGDLVTEADLHIDNGHHMPGEEGEHGEGHGHHGVIANLDDPMPWTNRVATAGDDVLRGAGVNGVLNGLAGNDIIVDGGRRGDKDRDLFDGGDGNDVIRSFWGSVVLRDGLGDDVLISRSDAGEPHIAQNRNLAKVYAKEPFLAANDEMMGGLGADVFYFRLDLSGRQNILAEHTEDDGHIHWHGVAGENAAAHLHWVESIGTDTVRDFYRADGDKIVIEGHTVKVTISYADSNGDRRDDMSILLLRSNQGGAGSHDRDILGTIRVYGNLVTWDDITVDAGVHYGVADTIDQYAMA